MANRANHYRQPGTDPDWPTGITHADLDRALESNDVRYLYNAAGALMVLADAAEEDEKEDRRLREALEEAAEDSGDDAVGAIHALRKERDRLSAALGEIGDCCIDPDDVPAALAEIRRVVNRVAP